METSVTIPESNMLLMEQVEHLTSLFEERFDEVNPLWKQLEKKLLPLVYGKPVSFVYQSKQYAPDEPVTHTALGMHRINGEWGLYRAQYKDDTEPEQIRWVSIHKCPAMVRITATSGAAGLIEAVLEQAGNFLPTVDYAIRLLREALKPFPDSTV